MENNSDRMGFALIALSVVAFVLLAVNGPLKASADGLFAGFKSWQESTFSQILGGDNTDEKRPNPNDAKWVEKGNYGTNGYFVRDNDGNGIVYALDPQQPVIAPETAIFTQSNGNLTSLRFLDKTILPKNSQVYFADNVNLTTFDTKNLDTSNVTDMGGMFSGLSALTTLDVSNFDTSNVTDMGGMFFAMQSLTALDVSKFNTSNVTNMAYIFYDMHALTALNVSKFDTSNVTNMSGMFSGLWKLTTLDVSNFNTSNVIDVAYMFADMPVSTRPDTSKFDTSKMTNKDLMFANMLS